MQTQNMYELAEQLKQLREKKKNAEQRLKEMNAEIEQADYQLSMLMAETETQNFTRAGTTFALTTKIRASAVAGSSLPPPAGRSAAGLPKTRNCKRHSPVRDIPEKQSC